MTSQAQPAWLNDFLSGHFEKLPDPLTWEEDGRTISSLIDGYDLTGGLDELFVRVRRFWQNDPRMNYAGISASDLWIALFFEQRAERFRSTFCAAELYPDNNRSAVDALCAAFRAAVIRISIDERAGFLSSILRSR